MLITIIYIIASVCCIVHYYYDHEVWPKTITQSIMREDYTGNININGLLRYRLYFLINIVITLLISYKEIVLYKYYKNYIKRVRPLYDIKFTIIPYIIFISAGLLETLIKQKRNNTDSIYFSQHNRFWLVTEYIMSYISNFNIIILFTTILFKTYKRTTIQNNIIHNSKSLFILPLTHILSFSSIMLCIYTDVPRLYEMHIFLTVMAATSALVFLEVRCISHYNSVFLLLFIYTCFSLQKFSSNYNYTRALFECAAFAGFFTCYEKHCEYIATLNLN